MSVDEKESARREFMEKHSKDSEMIHKDLGSEDALTTHKENKEGDKTADSDEKGNQENIKVKSG